MEEILKEFEDSGIKVVVGWKEKQRKKDMRGAIKKLKESGDEKKIKLAKTLARYYGIFYNIGYIPNPEISLEEDKYGSKYLCSYLDGIVDTAKRVIAAVIKALGNDEPLDPFCKYLTGKQFQKLTRNAKKLGAESLDYSTRKNNKYMATLPSGKKVHFGSPKYPDYTIHKDKERRDKYLSRATKIKNKQGELTHTNPESSNYWSVHLLWPKKMI